MKKKQQGGSVLPQVSGIDNRAILAGASKAAPNINVAPSLSSLSVLGTTVGNIQQNQARRAQQTQFTSQMNMKRSAMAEQSRQFDINQALAQERLALNKQALEERKRQYDQSMELQMLGAYDNLMQRSSQMSDIGLAGYTPESQAIIDQYNSETSAILQGALGNGGGLASLEDAYKQHWGLKAKYNPSNPNVKQAIKSDATVAKALETFKANPKMYDPLSVTNWLENVSKGQKPDYSIVNDPTMLRFDNDQFLAGLKAETATPGQWEVLSLKDGYKVVQQREAISRTHPDQMWTDAQEAYIADPRFKQYIDNYYQGSLEKYKAVQIDPLASSNHHWDTQEVGGKLIQFRQGEVLEKKISEPKEGDLSKSSRVPGEKSMFKYSDVGSPAVISNYNPVEDGDFIGHNEKLQEEADQAVTYKQSQLNQFQLGEDGEYYLNGQHATQEYQNMLTGLEGLKTLKAKRQLQLSEAEKRAGAKFEEYDPETGGFGVPDGVMTRDEWETYEVNRVKSEFDKLAFQQGVTLPFDPGNVDLSPKLYKQYLKDEDPRYKEYLDEVDNQLAKTYVKQSASTPVYLFHENDPDNSAMENHVNSNFRAYVGQGGVRDESSGKLVTPDNVEDYIPKDSYVDIVGWKQDPFSHQIVLQGEVRRANDKGEPEGEMLTTLAIPHDGFSRRIMEEKFGKDYDTDLGKQIETMMNESPDGLISFPAGTLDKHEIIAQQMPDGHYNVAYINKDGQMDSFPVGNIHNLTNTLQAVKGNYLAGNRAEGNDKKILAPGESVSSSNDPSYTRAAFNFLESSGGENLNHGGTIVGNYGISWYWHKEPIKQLLGDDITMEEFKNNKSYQDKYMDYLAETYDKALPNLREAEGAQEYSDTKLKYILHHEGTIGNAIKYIETGKSVHGDKSTYEVDSVVKARYKGPDGEVRRGRMDEWTTKYNNYHEEFNFKDGVPVETLQAPAREFLMYLPDSMKGLTITSTTDSLHVHKEGSYHAKGLAIDVRSNEDNGQDFLKWVRSPDGQAYLSRMGFEAIYEFPNTEMMKQAGEELMRDGRFKVILNPGATAPHIHLEPH